MAEAWDRSMMFYELADARLDNDAQIEGCPRIAVIGDSFAQGAGVQINDRYAAENTPSRSRMNRPERHLASDVLQP